MGKLAYLSVLFLLVIFSHLHATANARKFPPSHAGAKKHDIYVSTITMVKKMLQVPEAEAQTGTVEEGDSGTETEEGTKSEDDSKTETEVESKLKGDSETETETGEESKGHSETETEGTKSKEDSETETETETEGGAESETKTEEDSDQIVETPWSYDGCIGKPCDKYEDINESDNLDPYYCKYEDCDCSTLYGIGGDDDDDHDNDHEEPHCMEKMYIDGEIDNFPITDADDIGPDGLTKLP